MMFWILLLQFLVVPCPAQKDFLENWMGYLMPIIGRQTLLDISLPGTHDTMTYDLSTIVSLAGDDDSEIISTILHYASELGIVPGDWIRNQSKTQGLDITQQLNNGVRFIDFRNMLTSDDWHCLHFMQSRGVTTTYFELIRDWLVAHPNEVIAMWISKHGDADATGDNQYPGVSVAEKRAYWSKIEQIFGGLLFDTSKGSTNVTTLSQMITLKQRLVIYAADWVEFTGNSPLAYNSATNLDNELNGNAREDFNQSLNSFKNGAIIRKQDKAKNRFFLQSMAAGEPKEAIEMAFFIRYLDIEDKKFHENCAKVFGVPGLTTWCPQHLQSISFMDNYYNQIVLSLSLTRNYVFPNAIYIDAVDTDGTIRTGTELFSSSSQDPHSKTAFAYAYTLLLHNVRRACGSSPSGECVKMEATLASLCNKYPVQRWHDPERGRHLNWPIIPPN